MGSSENSLEYFFLESVLRGLGGQEDEVAVEVRTIRSISWRVINMRFDADTIKHDEENLCVWRRSSSIYSITFIAFIIPASLHCDTRKDS